MIRRPPRSTLSSSSAASDVYKRQLQNGSVVALLAGLWRGIKSELDAAAHELAPDLRPSHVRLLSLTPRDGMRVGDLAARAGMTAQSLGAVSYTHLTLPT